MSINFPLFVFFSFTLITCTKHRNSFPILISLRNSHDIFSSTIVELGFTLSVYVFFSAYYAVTKNAKKTSGLAEFFFVFLALSHTSLSFEFSSLRFLFASFALRLGGLPFEVSLFFHTPAFSFSYAGTATLCFFFYAREQLAKLLFG